MLQNLTLKGVIYLNVHEAMATTGYVLPSVLDKIKLHCTGQIIDVQCEKSQ